SALLPAVQHNAFGDGSVRPVAMPSDVLMTFKNAKFFSALEPRSEDRQIHGGDFYFQDPAGNSITGILIGLLLPAESGQSFRRFRGVVIAPEATGAFSNATGFGDVRWKLSTAPGAHFEGRFSSSAVP
ncbi:MAG: hypothetical protein ABR589_10645, partial [Chthoniobacterales bacterium]